MAYYKGVNKVVFPIAHLMRSDIEALGFEGAESLTDDVMMRIAEKMQDAYVSEQFWNDLEYFVENMTDLEKTKDADFS